MKRTLPALLLCGVLLFSVPALTEDALLRSLFGWTAYFARIPADAAETTRYPRMGLDVERLLARAVRIFRIRRRRNPHDLCAAARPREARAG